MTTLPNGPGTYVLILRLDSPREIAVGRLGTLRFARGTYAYVGSALNGWQGRVHRHFRGGDKVHWHIDHLRGEASVPGAFVSLQGGWAECAVAMVLSSVAEPGPMGFGCSDCDCETHLFRLGRRDVERLPLLLPTFRWVANDLRERQA